MTEWQRALNLPNLNEYTAVNQTKWIYYKWSKIEVSFERNTMTRSRSPSLWVCAHQPVVETLVFEAAGLVVVCPYWQEPSPLHPCQKKKHTNISHEHIRRLLISIHSLQLRWACESGNWIRRASSTLAITRCQGNGCLASPYHRTLSGENMTPIVIIRPVKEPPSQWVASIKFFITNFNPKNLYSH